MHPVETLIHGFGKGIGFAALCFVLLVIISKFMDWYDEWREL